MLVFGGLMVCQHPEEEVPVAIQGMQATIDRKFRSLLKATINRKLSLSSQTTIKRAGM